MSEYIHNIRHVCNKDLMQFTLGKTEKTINDIQQDTQEWLEYLEINDDTVPGTLHIPIILTNNVTKIIVSLKLIKMGNILLKNVLPALK